MGATAFFGSVAVLSWYLTTVSGHAGMLSPSPRKSGLWSWQNCGGRYTQNYINHGKCGICGMEYKKAVKLRQDGKPVEGHSRITAWWTAGQIVEVQTGVTAHHKGYFEFSICPRNSEGYHPYNMCFDKHTVELADGSGTRFYLPPDGPDKVEKYPIAVRIPADICCTHCLFRWTYKTGNSAGPYQEHFRSCANVEITGCDNPNSKTTVLPAETPLTTPKYEECVAYGLFKGKPKVDLWCKENCVDYRNTVHCPKSHCCCGDDCC